MHAYMHMCSVCVGGWVGAWVCDNVCVCVCVCVCSVKLYECDFFSHDCILYMLISPLGWFQQSVCGLYCFGNVFLYLLNL